MNQDAPINSAAIDRLVKLGGQKFALEMMGLFISYGGQKLDEARQARAAGNPRALAAAVHPLRSSGGNVGATRVQALAESVETLTNAAGIETASPHFGELEQAFAAAVTALESERARLAVSAPETKPENQPRPATPLKS